MNHYPFTSKTTTELNLQSTNVLKRPFGSTDREIFRTPVILQRRQGQRPPSIEDGFDQVTGPFSLRTLEIVNESNAMVVR